MKSSPAPFSFTTLIIRVIGYFTNVLRIVFVFTLFVPFVFIKKCYNNDAVRKITGVAADITQTGGGAIAVGEYALDHKKEKSPDKHSPPSAIQASVKPQVFESVVVITHQTKTDHNSVALEKEKSTQAEFRYKETLVKADLIKEHNKSVAECKAAVAVLLRRIQQTENTIIELQGSKGWDDQIDLKKAQNELPELRIRLEELRNELRMLQYDTVRSPYCRRLLRSPC